MTPRALKRLEDLLRLATDKSTTAPERELALAEALRMVEGVRAGKLAGEWEIFVAMRFMECAVCGEKIKPATKAWRPILSDDTPQKLALRMCDDCRRGLRA